jgi:UDP-2-acetamido-3-amino-2,3-dideoxy-glucuronate N-acetyltransferase
MGNSASIHETAVVDHGATLGDGTKVWHFCHVLGDSTIGADCALGQNVFVASKVSIGDRVRIQNNVSVYEGVTLEDDVFVGPSVVFTNVHHPRIGFPRHDQYAPTLVKRGATLGANCTIVCGNTVGEYALVAAGAVVTKTVAPHALVAGVPAKRIGWACRCGSPLPDSKGGRCEECGRSYELSDGALVEGEPSS